MDKQYLHKIATNNFLEYGRSVISDRALPDVNDGFKPVHRRILYSMYELGLSSGSKHKKSARVVGDVLGKYHPHGDSSVYEAMVRMSQDFSMRYPIVDGQGNFGSVDGDGAAAMRYTEARLTKIANYMIGEINKDTVDYQPNYDGTEQEPIIMANTLPTLLMNGGLGIAVGLATSIPPHNLNELLNAVDAKLQGGDIYEHIKAPDFPTGGILINADEATSIYKKGSGAFVTRCLYTNTDKEVVITEIPYSVNKSKLITSMAKLVKTKVITEISDIRDESSRTGMRIVIKLKRGVNVPVLMNKLFKKTQLETNFSINFTVLVEGKPYKLTLDEIITNYVEHLKSVFIRTAEFEHKDLTHKQNIKSALIKALENIDGVIAIIKEQPSPLEAIKTLLTVDDAGAKAIIDMKLRRLSNANADQLRTDIEEIKSRLLVLDATISDPTKDILAHNVEMSNKFGDARRTSLQSISGVTTADLIKKEDIEIILTNDGFIKRQPVSDLKIQNVGGTGKRAIKIFKGDFIKSLTRANTHQDILIFTNMGKAYKVKGYDISDSPKGVSAANLIDIKYELGEKPMVILPVDTTKKYVFIYLTNGIGKKMLLSELDRVNLTGKIATKLKLDEQLGGAILLNDGDTILSTSNEGKSLQIETTELRPMGRSARGVKIQNASGVKMVSISPEVKDVLIITEGGQGKKMSTTQIPIKGRGGKGMKAINLDTPLSIVHPITESIVSIMTSKGNKISIDTDTLHRYSRTTKGHTIIKVGAGDKVT